MRILQINSVAGAGSTGKTVRDIADCLRSNGHECYIAYGHGTSDDTFAFKVGSDFENLCHNLFYTRICGLQGHGTKNGTRKLIQWIQSVRPDVVHFHNLHINYLNYRLLFDELIRENIPVLFTLHDCFDYTGVCAHYTAHACFRWKQTCGPCPYYRSATALSWFRDRSRRMFEEKKSIYARLPEMAVVAVSDWLKNEAGQSIMTVANRQVHRIYNWIDTSVFRPSDEAAKEKFRQKYRLAADKEYLVAVSQLWDKNQSRCRDACRLAEILPSRYRLILIGHLSPGSRLHSGIIHIPYISEVTELAAAYSLASAYLHFSVEDSFGKVIAEAMACGTPPVTFDSTACAEVPGPYGAVVPPHDVEAMLEAVKRMHNDERTKNDMLSFIRSRYDKESNLKQYLQLYSQLAERR